LPIEIAAPLRSKVMIRARQASVAPNQKTIQAIERRVIVPAYHVRFLKNVSDDTGHDHRTLQATFAVEGQSSDEALTAAQNLFCAAHHVQDWRFYADAFEIAAAEQPPFAQDQQSSSRPKRTKKR
jgi:hypothetical protein